MIEMNICHRYGSVFWKTACLSINAGLIGDSTSGTDYGSIAKAIGDMKEYVLNPDINDSDMGFTPLESEGKILFGLKPIPGLGVDAIQKIISNRPYNSFDDFYERIIETKVISEGRGVILIKAGCFDRFNKDRRKLMVEYVRRVVPKRKKITMVQLPVVMNFVDKEKFKDELELYHFRQACFGRNKVEMNNKIETYFIKNLKDKVEYKFNDSGVLEIDKKSFEKHYGKAIEPLKEWVYLPEVADEFNKIKMREFWMKNCMGTIEAWEMETILFYSNHHEMDFIPLHKYFDIEKFNNLPRIPEIAGFKTIRGRRVPQNKISVISGTVVDKNKGKSLFYVSTQDGVVTVRLSKGQFSHYDKKVIRVSGKDKEVLDTSWFTRGTKMILVGFRRGDEFVLRKTGSTFPHTIFKINKYDQENVFMQTEKAKE